MEAKKSQKANLEGKRTIFLQIGFCVSLGLMILVFGFGQGTKIIPDLSPQEEFIPVETIEVTRQDPLQPQVPTPAQALSVLSEVIRIVDNETKIEVTQVFAEFDDALAFNDAPTSGVEVLHGFDDDLFFSAEFMPKFQGGDLATFRNWVQSRTVFPPMAQSMGISGTVTVQFVIERDGSLTNIEVINSPDSMLDNEALRVLRQSPRWEPGKQGEIPVRVVFTMPIAFVLQ
ncbi:MAG: energy transducer TonB [Rikenellaceae bacterium]|nr:energy transducer TonB [Rikenellaceae bacterium]MCL2691837.1 energy transducer TonB [Rikenellaceae bacterium]